MITGYESVNIASFMYCLCTEDRNDTAGNAVWHVYKVKSNL